MQTHNAIGLSNALTNVIKNGDIREIFQPTRYTNLTFMSSGTIPPNPADILIAPKTAMMLQFCKRKFDLIIIDCPPVIGLSDAPIISRLADATLLVVACKQATRKSAVSALKRLKSAGANVVGAAFTKFEVNKLDYNYAYRYMQYNYYSYDGGKPATPSLQDNRVTRNDNASFKNKTSSALSGMLDRFASRFG